MIRNSQLDKIKEVAIIIDRSPTMLLVSGSETALQEVLKEMPGWSLYPEQLTPIPDTRQTVG
jgi:hypothetical protein